VWDRPERHKEVNKDCLAKSLWGFFLDVIMLLAKGKLKGNG